MLRFSVDAAAGFTAQEAIDLLAADGTLSLQFSAQLDCSTDAMNDGSGNLAATATPVSFAGGKDAALTLGDVLDLINNHPTNLASGPPVVARLAAFGNGIELVNDGPPAIADLAVTKLNSSTAAVALGLLSSTSESSPPPTASGTSQILTGTDPNPQQVDGVFTALYRLRNAIKIGDQAAIEIGINQLDAATTHLNFVRGDIGARMRGLDVIQDRIEAENISLRQTLSAAIEVDLAEAISELALRQASFEASLQVAAQLARTTLLDYL
jgi:flagellar hook-associated protein 3 FlgL